ncbi:MAG: ABC transporter substrate-binding protein, partial [Maritimibacter sp.]|nr:ABC transporter substrate-binding protein [Maritimibacter sp.]
GTIVQDPYQWGYQGMKLMAAWLDGDTSGVPDDGLIIVPTKVIDQENVDAFQDELMARIGG